MKHNKILDNKFNTEWIETFFRSIGESYFAILNSYENMFWNIVEHYEVKDSNQYISNSLIYL